MYSNKSAHIFLGPVDEYAVASIARLSSHWDIPLSTGGGLIKALADKREYSYLTRLMGPYTKLSDFIYQFFNTFGWKKSALLYANNLNENVVKGKTSCYFLAEGIYNTLKTISGSVQYFTRAFDQNLDYNPIAILKDISLLARGKLS